MCLCNMGWRLLDCPWLSRMRDDDGGDDVDAGVRLRRSDSCLVFEMHSLLCYCQQLTNCLLVSL